MEKRKFKNLQNEVMQIIENYKSAHPVSQAVNVNGAFMRYSRDLVKRIVAIAQTENDPMVVMRKLEEETWLAKSEASRYVSVKTLLDQYGWDRIPIKVDSSKLMQSYMVGDKEITVTNWFNGSVCEYDGKRYMAYRIDAMPWTVNTRIAMCMLDNNWQPIPESNWLLDLPYCDSFAEDPRLFIHQGRICLSYADGCSIGLCFVYPADKVVANQMFIDKPYKRRMEKNWTFFSQGASLYCVYTTTPHVVYKVGGDGSIEMVCNHKFPPPPDWRWGWGDDIGGGTCPILAYNGDYLSFFHSRIQYPEHMRGQIHRQYHMGCYVFDHLTFKPVAVSKEPLMSGTYIDPEIPHGGNHNFNVFPMSAIHLPQEDRFRITAGINDYEIWHIDISQSELEENLVWF